MIREVYILCINCHRQIVKMLNSDKEIECPCGTIVKNPYFKDKKEEQNNDLDN